MPRLLVTLVVVVFLIAPATNAQAPVRRCDACGQVILDEYIVLEGRSFHPDHILCAYCSKRIEDTYVTADKQFYHGECYQKRFVVVCTVCNKVVLDHYVQDFWGNRVHEAHKDNIPQCDFCERFIAGGFAASATQLPDGRRLCGHCAATSVTTPDKVKDLAGMVSSSLAAHGIKVSLDDTTYRLLGKEKMKKMSYDPERHALGFTNFEYLNTGDVTYCSIEVLNGMPELQMAAVLAHEIMHVWLFRGGVRTNGTPWIEGSCEYAAYLLMSDSNTKESQFVVHNFEANQDSIYGDGFRQVKAFVEKHGVAGWLDALMPPGGE